MVRIPERNGKRSGEVHIPEEAKEVGVNILEGMTQIEEIKWVTKTTMYCG